MKPVFADTYYFLALVNPHDAGHAAAVAYSQQPYLRCITTTWVLVEVADALASPETRQVAAQLIERILADPAIEVVPASQALFDRGLELYESRADKRWSLTDCISMTVMQERGLTEALTGDRDFEQAGYRALLAE